ncbi:MAG: glutathione S-transferase N-terminal domain-containing protein [Candidatus Pacearchaeota archaeon]|nr:MAG: glutathione S-transferase N-terminal domain-containing protein [Candidatus Pacearchaeota archaeon]
MKVKVYSTPICPWCGKLKDWLKEKNIEFEEIDVSIDLDSAKKMVEKTGQMGVPVTEIDGRFIVGFDINKLKQLLKIKE